MILIGVRLTLVYFHIVCVLIAALLRASHSGTNSDDLWFLRGVKREPCNESLFPGAMLGPWEETPTFNLSMPQYETPDA